jgi:hypothetical protein
MKLCTTIVGAAAVALVATCAPPQRPLTDAQRAALGDSVDQVASRMMASFATQATADHMLSFYVSGNELAHAEYGMIFPTYDSLVKAARAFWRPYKAVQLALSEKHLTVLDRDVVVLTAFISGTVTDSANQATPVREAWTAVFHRTSDGWKIAADHESMAPPAPAAKSARGR